MKREELIQYIRANDKFYKFVNFEGHSLDELRRIMEKIKTDSVKAPMEKEHQA